MILYKIHKYFPDKNSSNLVRCSFVEESHILRPEFSKRDMNICSAACGECKLFMKVLNRSIMWCKHESVYRLKFDENK